MVVFVVLLLRKSNADSIRFISSSTLGVIASLIVFMAISGALLNAEAPTFSPGILIDHRSFCPVSIIWFPIPAVKELAPIAVFIIIRINPIPKILRKSHGMRFENPELLVVSLLTL